ncbi:hypothetical protein [Lignipirellula cremea]|uniref:DUF4279 domain-containing protein n=1 Tax=Lignipirellula cremea TaxID=2528010 RepID=A0A518DZ38_9BACT|nr:hypothetical protein [Lignipirellula cremea]QDU97102.1 hypothetical protein Pla8534_49280 [Lignipirellula cremea]
MHLHRLVLSIAGLDPQIGGLNDLLGLPYYETPRQLPEGQGVHSSVVVWEATAELETISLEDLFARLAAHHAALHKIQGRKCLEMVAVLLPADGSVMLHLDRNMLQSLEALNCEVSLQVAKVYSKPR